MRVAFVADIAQVGQAEWNALVPPGDPFLDHRFLLALEASGSVGPDTGWAPMHALAREGGRLVAAMPLYVKTDSYGEFIFDFGWAQAAHRAGLPYYPKLVAAVPFTPAGGRRLLAAAADEARALAALIPAVRERMAGLGASGLHVLFLTAGEADRLQGMGFHRRLTYQFHWENAGYASFDDYLAALRSPARKQVRKERRAAAGQGLTFRTLAGPELGDAEWHALDACYRSTIRRKGGFPYLTPEFLGAVRRTYAERLIANLAYDGARPVAAAYGFWAGGTLYGRYWGTLVEADCLHFELCYYRFIDWAIARGVTRFEAGAQGEHKIKRGFLPSPIHSVHAFAHAGFDAAVAEYLGREQGAVREEMSELGARTPFRRNPE